MLKTILPKNYIIQWNNWNFYWLSNLEIDSTFDNFSKWGYFIGLWLKNCKINDWQINTYTTERYWELVTIHDVKIRNTDWTKIDSKYTINEKWDLIDKGKSEPRKYLTPDIIKDKDWKDIVGFLRGHVYSIERCYEDNWEKRVRVINPRHTGIKFDISLEQAKQIFNWEVTGINIDQMFREE